MKTVALFGGSFDPPHAAHLLAATYVLSAAPVDELWVLPVAHHPLGKQPSADFGARLHLCRLAFALLGERAVVRDDEVASTGRTLDLLQRLMAAHPDCRFRLVIGSDILAEQGRWHRFDEVLRLAPPILLRRPGYPLGVSMQGLVLPAELPDLSSSQLRARLAAGQDCRGWTAVTVAQAIADGRLYAGGRDA